jgi:hypothetical protein
MTTKHVVDEVSADDIIQEHREQEVVQAFIDADSTDEFINLVIMLAEAGLDRTQVGAYLSRYHVGTGAVN